MLRLRHKQLPSKRTLPDSEWWDLLCGPVELRPDCVLTPGQSFSWKRVTADQWLGVIGKGAVLVKQTDESTLVRPVGGLVTLPQVRTYFGLDVAGATLTDLYPSWSAKCPRLAEVARCVPGMRVLQQDPVETVFSFICSQNNNVSRISLILDRIRAELGDLICAVPAGVRAIDDDGPAAAETRELTHVREFNERSMLYRFPSLEALASVRESTLRKLGLGYRTTYIRRCAQALIERGGMSYLENLREMPRAEIRNALCELYGIGPKVADCIALSCLHQHACVPVDVHVWRITTRDYLPSLRLAKSLTPQVYEQVGEAFRSRFGEFAGWAQHLLFSAELAGALRSRLPDKLLGDMDRFREEEKRVAKTLQEERTRKRKTGSEEASSCRSSLQDS